MSALKLGLTLICSLKLTLLIFASTASAADGPASFSYEGRLTTAAGDPIEATNVTFNVKVLSADGLCTLLDENTTLNMTASNGYFALNVGSGTRVSGRDPGNLKLARVFANGILIPANNVGTPNPCSTPYTPAGNEIRKIRIAVDDGVTQITMTPDVVVHSSPNAMVAETLQGKTPDFFIQTIPALETTAGTTQNRIGSLVNTRWTALDSLINGTSNLYATTTPPAAPVAYNNQRLTDIANPTGAQDAATKNYSDNKIGGANADSASLAGLVGGDAGKAIVWDGSKWVAQTPLATDNSKLPLTGGTLTGSLYVQSGNVGIGTTTPTMKLQVDGGIRIGASGESCGGGTNMGGIKYETGNLQYCNGSSWQTLGTAGGGITALTGDISATGTGSVAATIGPQAVSFNKIQNMSSMKLLGRTSAGTGSIEELGFGNGLSVSGSFVSANIGQNAGAVMGADAVPNCPPTQKLQMSLGPTYNWSCVASADFKSDGSVAMTGALKLVDGTATNPSFTFASDALTGFYYSAGNITYSSSGVSRMEMNSARLYSLTAKGPSLQWAGSSSTPAYSFTGDSQTGIYSPATGEMGFVSSGASRLHIAATGKIGVGLTAPTSDLQFSSTTAKIISVAAASGASIGKNLTVSAGAAGTGTNISGGDLYLVSGSATGTGGASIHFGTSGAGVSGTAVNDPTTRMSIAPTGYVGIGTTSPTNPLQVFNSAAPVLINAQSAQANALISFKDIGTSQSPMIGSSGNDLVVISQGADRIRFAPGVTTLSSHIKIVDSGVTLTSCGSGATVVTGNATRGQIIVGTGTVTACAIGFIRAHTSNPVCVVSPAVAIPGQMYVSSATTTELVVTFSTSSPGVTFNYICIE